MDWFIRAKSTGFLDPVDITIFEVYEPGDNRRRVLYLGGDDTPYIAELSHYSAVGVSLVLSHDDAVTLRNDLSAALGKPGDAVPSDPPLEVQPDDPPADTIADHERPTVDVQDVPEGGYFEALVEVDSDIDGGKPYMSVRVCQMRQQTLARDFESYDASTHCLIALGGDWHCSEIIPHDTEVKPMRRVGRDSRGDSTFVYV